MRQIIAFSTIILAIFTGCELYEQDGYTEYYVVESYLIAEGQLPPVRLSTTAPIDESYTFEDNALSNASVEIRLLDSDSSVVEIYPYSESNDGIYIPDVNTEVQSQRLYQLHVVTNNGDTITSTTYVPENFRTVNQLQNRYTYQSDQQIEITTTPSSYITNRQTYYIFSVNAVDPDSSDLTPFYRDLVIEQDNDIENYYINSSGIINEGNYTRNENGNIELQVPWLAIAFYNLNDVVTTAIDNNIYDFLRSQDVQSGGTSLSPGVIQNIEYNVNGGIGVFGSMAADTNRIFVEPAQNQDQ
jgi:hypothetical protein